MDFKNVVRQFTTNEKAKEIYSTIIVDEVYASSLFCQDYVCNTFGNGALTLADGDSRHNLYQLYEKEYFKQINTLANSGFTIVFIAHEQENTQTGFITPKGDKRCMNPIVDRCDYVVYLKGNGIDNEGRVIKSSAYLAATDKFFARARVEYTPTFIKEFTAENLEAAIQEGIDLKAKKEGATVVTYEEQSKQNQVEDLNFEQLMLEFQTLVSQIMEENQSNGTKITSIVDKVYGKNKKVTEMNSSQVEVLYLIVQELKDTFKK